MRCSNAPVLLLQHYFTLFTVFRAFLFYQIRNHTKTCSVYMWQFAGPPKAFLGPGAKYSITNILARRRVRDWTHLWWLEVSRTHRAKQGEFGKLPATQGASNPGLTKPASMVGFYPIHRAIHIFVALHNIFVHVLSTFFRPKKSLGS
jgi:hypothetical protein